MNKADIYNSIKKFVADDRELEDDLDLFKDLDFDSLKFVEMLAELEELVGKGLDDIYEKCNNPNNVGMICTYVLEAYNKEN